MGIPREEIEKLRDAQLASIAYYRQDMKNSDPQGLNSAWNTGAIETHMNIVNQLDALLAKYTDERPAEEL